MKAIYRFTHHHPDQFFHNVLVDLERVGSDLVTQLARALPYAQALNDYDTADFAAAFIAGNKTGPKDVQLLPHGAWEVSAPLDEPMLALITVTQFTTGHVHVFIELALQLRRGEWMTLKLGSDGLKKLASRAV